MGIMFCEDTMLRQNKDLHTNLWELLHNQGKLTERLLKHLCDCR